MSCKCIENLNKELEKDERKARLELTLTMDGKVYPYMSATFKKGKQIKEHHIIVVPSFCPFCGKEYEGVKPKGGK
jgi:hypothetical protein